ncbi:hypothetical protein [Arthrobacter sp. efr-133-TYG-118]|uniref:hypothetical protein n=1 Tax=Arthrobacter sp. efr-133-TYG-118 TaxID=3040279 RepID=UPI00254D7128|nr:hypothetical protein [Arthrobacter sp. efr-133-TYG-118]
MKAIIGSAIGVLVTIGVAIFVMSLMVPPSDPGFGAGVAVIISVFILVEFARILIMRRRRRNIIT